MLKFCVILIQYDERTGPTSTTTIDLTNSGAGFNRVPAEVVIADCGLCQLCSDKEWDNGIDTAALLD